MVAIAGTLPWCGKLLDASDDQGWKVATASVDMQRLLSAAKPHLCSSLRDGEINPQAFAPVPDGYNHAAFWAKSPSERVKLFARDPTLVWPDWYSPDAMTPDVAVTLVSEFLEALSSLAPDEAVTAVGQLASYYFLIDHWGVASQGLTPAVEARFLEALQNVCHKADLFSTLHLWLARDDDAWEISGLGGEIKLAVPLLAEVFSRFAQSWSPQRWQLGWGNLHLLRAGSFTQWAAITESLTA